MNKRKNKPKNEVESKVPRKEDEPEQGELLIDDQMETNENNQELGDKVKQNTNQLVNDMEELGFPSLGEFPVDLLNKFTSEIINASEQVK